jgi:NhaA family Na+:H+ antiporter
VIEELEDRIHPWSSFLVLPLFALANAGVALSGDALSEGDGTRVAVAVAVGLVAGKAIGISTASLLAIRFRLGLLPEGVDRNSVFGIAALSGIGFTVSLFIASLSFDSAQLTDAAKIGILAGSVASAAIGVALLAPGGRHPSRE